MERSQRDWLFAPIMAVCALTICTLVTVLAVNLFRMRRRSRDYPILPQTQMMPHGFDGKKPTGSAVSNAVPEGVQVTGGGIRSKHSSTSSWPDESLGQQSSVGGTTEHQLDIGTGHVILAYLQERVDKPGEISREWESVRDYVNLCGETSAAQRPENASANVDPKVLPCEEKGERQTLDESYPVKMTIRWSNSTTPSHPSPSLATLPDISMPAKYTTRIRSPHTLQPSHLRRTVSISFGKWCGNRESRW